MKISVVLSFFLAQAAAVNAFVVPSSPTTTTTTTSSSSSILRSTFSPEDFSNDPKASLLETLNVPKREKGEPLIENILEPNYDVALATAAAGPISYAIWGGSLAGVLGNSIHVVLASLIWIQTLRVRCAFEEDGFQFYNLKDSMDLYGKKKGGKRARLAKKPSNFVTKTENKWSYDSVTGYQFFPTEKLPLIVYLKETDTPAQYGLPEGSEQPHFFPTLFSAEQFKQEMNQRDVPYGV